MIQASALQHHLSARHGEGRELPDGHVGAAGGAACGDLIRISVLAGSAGADVVVLDAGFAARGCAAVRAAGSAVVEMVCGKPLLDAARIGAAEISDSLGGLSAAGAHVADLAAEALHRALGRALMNSPRTAPRADRKLVALSGGVDSAVAALLVMQAGAEAIGVTVELWSDPRNDGERSCCSPAALRDARAIAHSLGLPHFSIDLRDRFRAAVVDRWIAEQHAGLTPNPCFYCNGEVRIDAMLDLAGRIGAAALVTGHYARKAQLSPAPGRAGGGGRQKGSGRVPPPVGAVGATRGPELAPADGPGRGPAHGECLRVAAIEAKDQSYALAGLSADAITMLEFPLGAMSKDRVRGIARAAGLGVAAKRDSQDLCFLAGTDRGSFLARHAALRDQCGAITDRAGRALGRHDGYRNYTVGQRRGIGVGGELKYFVLATDAERNEVIVGPREELLSGELTLDQVRLLAPVDSIDSVKIRSRGRRLPCRPIDVPAPAERGAALACASPASACAPGQSQATAGLVPTAGGARPGALWRNDGADRLRLELSVPAERTAPGQLACLYRGDLLVGHGLVAAAEWPGGAARRSAPAAAPLPTGARGCAPPKISRS